MSVVSLLATMRRDTRNAKSDELTDLRREVQALKVDLAQCKASFGAELTRNAVLMERLVGSGNGGETT